MPPLQNPLLCSSTELCVAGCLNDLVYELPEHGGGEEGTHHPAAGQAAGHQERQQHRELGGRARRQGHQGSHQVLIDTSSVHTAKNQYRKSETNIFLENNVL
jgi:hypothetical protein